MHLVQFQCRRRNLSLSVEQHVLKRSAMERLEELGTAISRVVAPTFKIYTPLLLNRADQIRSTRHETFSYATESRQQLDIYYPSPETQPRTSNPNAILIFLYGGGLVNGEKSNEKFVNGLVYANLGHYFTQHLGIPVVVVDYRLISHGAKYPSGGEDLRLAIDWAVSRFGQDSLKPLDLYLLGNSAGAIHTSTYLLAPEFATHRRRMTLGVGPARLKAVVLVGTPFHFDHADESRNPTLSAYFGGEMSRKCPFGLLKAANEKQSLTDLAGIRLLILTSSLDPEDEILIPNADFVQEWKGTPAVANQLEVNTIQGHNHISPVLGLGTGIACEEAWGNEVTDFVIRSS